MKRDDGLPTIGLALIVRNEAETLGPLLDSVGFTQPESIAETDWRENYGWTPEDGGWWRPDAAVDFVVVCDTGSSDETKTIAQARGCKVVEFAWTDDFSEARQASYDALPEVDFTLWADGDDTITGAEKLRDLAARMPPEVSGWIARYDYARDPAGNCVCELWRERLVRKGIGERWQLPIHEVLAVPGALLHTTEVEWVHRPPPERERDPERNYKILARSYQKAKEAGEPPDTRTLAYLGTEALALGRGEYAVERFREYLARPDAKWDEERCQVAHKLSIALRMGEEPDLDGSAQAAQQAIAERADWPDGYLDLAEIALRREDPARALRFCEVAERLDYPKTLLIVNPLEYRYQPVLMRSVALAKLGQTEAAWEATQKALAFTPEREDLQGQAAAVAHQVKVLDTARHFLTLRELLIRHDENWKAALLMKACPYYIADLPEVAHARRDTREMVLHATDPEAYAAYYRENPGEAPFEMQGVPIPEAHERFHRVRFLREGLREQAA